MLDTVLYNHINQSWAKAGITILHEIIIGWLVRTSLDYSNLDASTRRILDNIYATAGSNIEAVLERYQNARLETPCQSRAFKKGGKSQFL